MIVEALPPPSTWSCLADSALASMGLKPSAQVEYRGIGVTGLLGVDQAQLPVRPDGQTWEFAKRMDSPETNRTVIVMARRRTLYELLVLHLGQGDALHLRAWIARHLRPPRPRTFGDLYAPGWGFGARPRSTFEGLVIYGPSENGGPLLLRLLGELCPDGIVLDRNMSSSDLVSVLERSSAATTTADPELAAEVAGGAWAEYRRVALFQQPAPFPAFLASVVATNLRKPEGDEFSTRPEMDAFRAWVLTDGRS